ncbi:hypothetical protein [Psychrobacillus vulpis]|uniref:Uncharacterized protein n=1 Tax=Psychrobacillus vulpis TaxID=2325572 RepID=A0A544TNG8_9BACI|nr:hypothetical protein [Psychrobacillus vulpis]TQR18987.1 hypothetical protein FG384_15375 [Psychrobacillus vulpis]
MNMKHIYERTAKYTKLGSLLTLAIYLVLIIIFRDVMWNDFETNFITGFTLLILFGTSFFFQNAADKLPNEEKVDTRFYSVDFPVKELNFQRDVSIIPQSYLVSSTGERLYKISPSEDFPLIRKLSVFAILKGGMFFPITYDLKSMDGKLVCQFTIKNKLRFMQIKVNDHTKSHKSTIVLPTVSVKNRAIIFDANNEKTHQMEAKSMYGDIDINDINGKRLATYRFGMFPYATHPAFEVQAMNVHVSLAQDLSQTEKLSFVALFYYWTSNQ